MRRALFRRAVNNRLGKNKMMSTDMKPKFAAAINCIDGRVQVPLLEFIRKNYKVDYVDMVTVPGPDKVLSEYRDSREIESVKKKVLISYGKHNSRLIFIAGHDDCAANPCGKKEHLRQIREAARNISKWNIDAKIHGIWLDKAQKVFPVKLNHGQLEISAKRK